jgi:hypothetical protein
LASSSLRAASHSSRDTISGRLGVIGTLLSVACGVRLQGIDPHGGDDSSVPASCPDGAG